jgi:nicotinic acid mononucleotide adenylyltransferase
LAGSFDPPTVAHVALAETVRGEADLVLLVSSVRPLPKEGPAPPPLLSDEERLEALRAVCARRPGVLPALCSHGLLADQVAAAAERFPGARLFLALGSDKALQLLDPRWYEDRDAVLDALFARAEVRYAVRPGDEGKVEAALRDEANARWRDRFRRVELPPEAAAAASRRVREELRRGGWPDHLVPPEVRRVLGRAGGV